MRLQRVFVASLRIPVLPHFSWFFESRNISSTPIVHQKAQLSLSDIVSQAPIHGNCGRTELYRTLQTKVVDESGMASDRAYCPTPGGQAPTPRNCTSEPLELTTVIVASRSP